MNQPPRHEPLPPLYDPDSVRPMWEELAQCGVAPLNTPEEVDELLGRPGTALVVVNSVCGCAAGAARPGVTLALQHSRIPDHLGTVFAGVDRSATNRARAHMAEAPPSSPSVALFRDGKLIHLLERRQIETMPPDRIAENLAAAFDAHCGASGPSVPREVWERTPSARICGSSIPRFDPGRSPVNIS